MALSFEELRRLVEQAGLKYTIFPDRPAVAIGFHGLTGAFQFVVHLEEDGRFLQWRTVNYSYCPADNPHLTAVLRLLGELNYRYRLVKFAWDPSDGEIVVYADMWVMDGTVTQQQFDRMFHNVVPTVDTSLRRIRETVQTGRDPGEPSPQDLLREVGPRLPGPLRKLVEKLLGKSGPEAGGEPPDFSKI